MPTDKLYYSDAYTREFVAAATDISPLGDGRWGVVLDRTAFYPEGGGQPFDTGWLDDIPVLAVYEKNGVIIHETAAKPAGRKVCGRLDWERRFDHMQQHSGEHILSAVFADLFGAVNIGFHLGSDGVYIDVTLDALTASQAVQAEERANEVVFANFPVRGRQVTRDGLAAFDLRKQPARSFDNIRLVSVEGVDCCPCGGTHVAATGEIGLIKLRSWERKAGAVRIDFVCGYRALADYRLCSQVTRALATRFSVPVPDVPATIDRQISKAETLHKDLQTARQELNQHAAAALYEQAEEQSGVKLVAKVLDDATAPELADLARHILACGSAVVLLATASAARNKAQFVFACSPTVPADMGAVLKKALQAAGGKGGGNAHWAQGGGAYSDKLEDALRLARAGVWGE